MGPQHTQQMQKGCRDLLVGRNNKNKREWEIKSRQKKKTGLLHVEGLKGKIVRRQKKDVYSGG